MLDKSPNQSQKHSLSGKNLAHLISLKFLSKTSHMPKLPRTNICAMFELRKILHLKRNSEVMKPGVASEQNTRYMSLSPETAAL